MTDCAECRALLALIITSDDDRAIMGSFAVSVPALVLLAGKPRGGWRSFARTRRPDHPGSATDPPPGPDD